MALVQEKRWRPRQVPADPPGEPPALSLPSQIWVHSAHNASGYFTIYGDESLQSDHFNSRLSFGDTQTVWARTGYLGFLRRTELTDANGGKSPGMSGEAGPQPQEHAVCCPAAGMQLSGKERRASLSPHAEATCPRLCDVPEPRTGLNQGQEPGRCPMQQTDPSPTGQPSCPTEGRPGPRLDSGRGGCPGPGLSGKGGRGALRPWAGGWRLLPPPPNGAGAGQESSRKYKCKGLGAGEV